MEEFIVRLKELRTEQGLSQQELAKEIGVGRSSITYWERGEKIPSALVIIKLARYFGVTTDYLLGESDIK